MPVAVNLYVDRMSPQQPVRVADVYAVTQDRAAAYTEAAAKIGLTTREYTEFRQALTDGGAIYVRLPRRIDAMAGVHRRNGHVYALRNVVVPSGTMGWQVNLADGTTVLVPQICGNLSMNRPRAVAAQVRRQPKKVSAVVYTARVPAAVPASVPAAVPAAVAVPVTPVVFDVPTAAIPLGMPLTAAGVAGAHLSALPFLGLLFPIIVSAIHSTPAAPPEAPPCSGGSNVLGACRQ
jgi:hypothetical protein